LSSSNNNSKKDFHSAFNILKESYSAIEVSLLKTKLDEFGIQVENDLSDLDQEDIESIAEVLKKVPKTK
jgi:hypothetical protein